MKLYLVRHAESEANAKRIHQHAGTPLHARAGEQLKTLNERLKDLNIEALIASPYLRTKHTVEAIAKELGKPIEFSDYLVEIKRPSEMHGKTTTDPEVLKIQAELVKHFEEGNWRYSDEETFDELKTRGFSILKKVLEMKKESVLAVSHAAIIRVIVACAVFGEKLTAHDYMGLWHSTIDNVGITLLEHNLDYIKMSPWGNPWKLVSYNNRAL